MQETIQAQLQEILEDYAAEVKKTVNEAMDTVSKEGVQKLKSTSPKRDSKGKHYANGWAVKKARGSLGIDDVLIYNKTKPQLTHLLENGHVIANAHGTYGRMDGVKHIAPVEEWAAEELPAEIIRGLE